MGRVTRTTPATRRALFGVGIALSLALSLAGCSHPLAPLMRLIAEQDWWSTSAPPRVVVAATATGSSSGPNVAWTGTGFGVTWSDNRGGDYDLFSALVDPEGTRTGAELRLTTSAAGSYLSALAWTGSGFLVAWHETVGTALEIMTARLADDGAIVGSPIQLSGGAGTISDYPSVAWSGSELGVAWREQRDGNEEIYFGRLGADGSEAGADTRITSDAGDSTGPSLTWAGSEYGVAWRDNRTSGPGTYFARISAGGTKVGGDMKVVGSSGSGAEPSLGWDGGAYGLAWPDNRNGNYEIYFCRLDAAGTRLGDEVRLTSTSGSSLYPQLTALDDGWAVAWNEQSGASFSLCFLRLDSDGNPRSAPVTIVMPSGVTNAMVSSIAAGPPACVVGFSASLPSYQQAYLAVLELPR